MNLRVVLVVLLLAILLICGLIGAAVVTDDRAAASCGSAGSARSPQPLHTGRVSAVGQWNSEQVRYAVMIVAVGRRKQVPARGWVVAVATAMVESRLRNLPYGDRDSLGLFQQRPSQGWGTPAQVLDPLYAAGKFYDALAKVRGWDQMPVTVAAQNVQRSALPDAYAEFENDAERVVTAATGVATITDLLNASLAECSPVGDISADGWMKPVSAPVGSPYGPRGGRLHAGVDLSGRRNTVIRAASGGRVLWSGCDPGTGNCDIDGSPSTPGCGWYVDILHSGRIGTRYCHLVRRPDVAKGDMVAVSDPIGLMGTSGHSSGVHLHFEVHRDVCDGSDCDLSSNNSTDPVRFMQEVGAPLGEGS